MKWDKPLKGSNWIEDCYVRAVYDTWCVCGGCAWLWNVYFCWWCEGGAGLSVVWGSNYDRFWAIIVAGVPIQMGFDFFLGLARVLMNPAPSVSQSVCQSVTKVLILPNVSFFWFFCSKLAFSKSRKVTFSDFWKKNIWLKNGTNLPKFRLNN